MRPSSSSSVRAFKGLNSYLFGVVCPNNSLITRIFDRNAEATLKNVCVLEQSHVRYLSNQAEERYSDDECLPDDTKGTTRTCANVDKWKWKLNVLLQNPQKDEIVSKEKSDRRDYEHLESLAKKLGLYSQDYGQAVAFSKVPLPNYRPDLDDKRPIRKVQIPSTIHNAVEKLLQEHLDQKKMSREQSKENAHEGKVQPLASAVTIGTRHELSRSSLQIKPVNISVNPITEKILRKRSMYLRGKQQAWQNSSEGQKMHAFRMSLPAYKEKEKLLAAVANEQVLVVSGETGCGKTTQLPQYILETEIEAGRGASCSIICTQPRRISAISVSERVAAERGEQLGESVGYKVRLEGTRGKDTRLLFCTTGILLRRLLVDPNLRGVSHVIVDEIHERGMNEDFLLIVLKDLLLRRKDLKLVLMSATLNAALFSSYFGGASMMHIPGFTHPVRSFFLEDILETTGHLLSEQNQIDDYGQDKVWKMQKQKQDRKRKTPINSLAENALAGVNFEGFSDMTRQSLSQWRPEGLGFNLIQAVLCHICKFERDGAVLVFMTGWEDITALKDQLKCHPLLGDARKVLILPCYGAMASAEQKLIFERPPPDIRKIVLATNMAETSITINDVVFVVDCGKAKETSYDALNNTPCLLPMWISRASARQRRGRAGRVQPGECYHLYPRVVHDTFAEYQVPELLRMPLDSLCVQIKSLKLGSIAGFLSKALEPPEPLAVHNSIGLLKTIGVLDENEELTHLGQHLSMLPVDPRIGKMLIMGCIFGCFDPVLTIAAGLTVKDPFLIPTEKKEIAEVVRASFGMNSSSDHMALVHAYDGWKRAKTEGTASDYCWNNFLSSQTLNEMDSLRKQFRQLLSESGFLDAKSQSHNEYSEDHELLAAVICSGLFPNVASVLKGRKSKTFKTIEDGRVLLYQNSVLSKVENMPYPWLVFSEKVKRGTVILRDSTGISDSMLLLFGGKVEPGSKPGCLLMQNGWLEFYMLPEIAKTILDLKEELDHLLQKKLENPKCDVHMECSHLISGVLELLHGDQNLGTFSKAKSSKAAKKVSKMGKKDADVTDLKGFLQHRLQKNGFKIPTYKIRTLKDGRFQGKVNFMGMQFIGKPASSKKQSEKNAAAEGLLWLDNMSSSKNCQDAPSTRVSGSEGTHKLNKIMLTTNVSNQKRERDNSDVPNGKFDVNKIESNGKYSHLSDVKNLLQNRLQKHGFELPVYMTRTLKDGTFQAKVKFQNVWFIGKTASSKKKSEKSAATEALLWLDKRSAEYPEDSPRSTVSQSWNALKIDKSPVRKDTIPIGIISKEKRDSENEFEKARKFSHVSDVKHLLFDCLQKHGFEPPVYMIRSLKDGTFQGKVEFGDMQFSGRMASSKQESVRNAATEALFWLNKMSNTESPENAPHSRVSGSQNISKKGTTSNKGYRADRHV